MPSPKGDAPGESRPDLQISIVLPVFNEEANLPGCLGTLSTTFAGSPYEIVLVDDGSRDATLAIARRWSGEHPGLMQVIAHERNQGIGGAIRTGIDAARGDYPTHCRRISTSSPRTGPPSPAPWAGPTSSSAAGGGERVTIP